MLESILKHYPAGASMKQAMHFAQIAKSGKFQYFNYRNNNYRFYNTTEPPVYHLGFLKVPLNIFYGTNDGLLSVRDAKIILKKLSSATKKVFKLKGWAHHDFLYAIDSRKVIYEKILAMIDDASSNGIV